jgi:hypothetical protein
MICPSALDYSNAIQNPQLSFQDPELQQGEPELTPFGLPRPWSGNFATVFQMHCQQRDWAVRCFTRELSDQQSRYAVIHHHLEINKLPYTVQFDFIPKGIKVNNQWYPILKMGWVEGELLDHFIVKYLHNAKVLRQLALRWVRMVRHLETIKMAHGDLQHGNILIVKGNIKLVDYDAMFVPALGGQKSREIGHPNYQHPSRSASHFDVQIDRFSAWIIYITLVALSLNPDLWQLVGAGDEFILFCHEDFVKPEQSLLLALLATHEDPRLQLLAQLVEKLLALPLARIPPLLSLAKQFEPLLNLEMTQIHCLNEYINSQLRVEILEQLFPAENDTPTVITTVEAKVNPPTIEKAKATVNSKESPATTNNSKEKPAANSINSPTALNQTVATQPPVIDNDHNKLIDLPTALSIEPWLQNSDNSPPVKPAKDNAAFMEEVQWFQQAAQQGHAEAQYTLAWMYAQGKGVPQDLRQAAKLFRRAALKGYAEAQYHLGRMYIQGIGVPQNFTQAAHWFVKAAMQGHAAARQARVNLYLKIAEQGDVQAQYLLWEMSTQGETKITQPLQWLEKSAQQGYLQAQYTLGSLYEQSNNVSRDVAKAMYWYRQAIKQGHFLAIKRYFKLWVSRYQDKIKLVLILLLLLGISIGIYQYS